MTAVDQAYAEVQRVTRARAKNFAYGIMVLPREGLRDGAGNPTGHHTGKIGGQSE